MISDKLIEHAGKCLGTHKWKKGQSGNPAGRRPKDLSLTSLLKLYLPLVPKFKIDGKTNTRTWRELLVQAWLIGAYKGESFLFKELLERIDGRVTQSVYINIKTEAARLAQETGLDEATIIAEAERVLSGVK